MKFKWIVVLILTSGCTISQKLDTAFIEQSESVYFVSVPITKLSSIQSPCIDVDIDGKRFSMELDLGYRGDITVTKKSIDLFPSKEFIREKSMYGFRGKKYSTSLYHIPKAKIGKMTFFKPILQEEMEEFVKDSSIVQNGGASSPRGPGRLGWELFYNVNLLIDIKNSQIIFSDSLETLEKNGYSVKFFTKTPLILERGLVEFDAETPEGVLRCVLDTGASWNILNREIEEGKSVDLAIWESDNLLKYSSFNIGDKDFGSINFHRIPIKIPIHIEAILGMEFFQKNLVFLDFTGKTAYFLNQE